MLIDIGETWSSPNYEVRNTAGTLVDAGTVTALVTLWDGTTSTPTPAHPSTGTYTLDLTTVEGACDVLVTATGGALGSLTRRWSESFTAEKVRLLVSVDDAIAHLRGQTVINSAADRELLREFIQVATDVIERDLGRTFVRRLVVDTVDGGKSAVVLSQAPVLSIVSVTELGSPVTDFTLNGPAGILMRGTPLVVFRWLGGPMAVVVTYWAGYVVAPPCIRWACLGEVARMWQSTQQSPHRALDDYDAAAAIASAAGPSRSRTLINAYESLRMAVVA